MKIIHTPLESGISKNFRYLWYCAHCDIFWRVLLDWFKFFSSLNCECSNKSLSSMSIAAVGKKLCEIAENIFSPWFSIRLLYVLHTATASSLFTYYTYYIVTYNKVEYAKIPRNSPHTSIFFQWLIFEQIPLSQQPP